VTRARADDYDEKKKFILDKAAEIIAQKGFDVATMMDVASSCGASKSHLYHYFPSKEDLLFAIAHEHITVQAAELERIVNSHDDVGERFRRFIDSFVEGAAASRNQHLILMNDLKFLPAEQRDQIRVLEVQMTELLERLLVEMNPTVMDRSTVRKPYALMLFGMMIWTFSWYKRDGPIPPSELAGRIADLYVNGFSSLA
jgi:AcrR family transcriptional regulator